MRASSRNQGLEAEIIPNISDSNSEEAVNTDANATTDAEERDIDNVRESIPMSSIHSEDVNLEDTDSQTPSSTSPEVELEITTKSQHSIVFDIPHLKLFSIIVSSIPVYNTRP